MDMICTFILYFCTFILSFIAGFVITTIIMNVREMI